MQQVEALSLLICDLNKYSLRTTSACAWVPISPRSCKGKQKLLEDACVLCFFCVWEEARTCSPASPSAFPWPQEILAMCRLHITGKASKICDAMESKASSWEGYVPGQVSKDGAHSPGRIVREVVKWGQSNWDNIGNILVLCKGSRDKREDPSDETRTLKYEQNKMIHLWRLQTSLVSQIWLEPKNHQARTRKCCTSFRKYYLDASRIDKRNPIKLEKSEPLR